ncbi:hypothetical protein KJ865_16675, partial [Myxococcota bacterium]|nr:hypothetical protein [Myxococcota bacterium]
MKTLVTLLTFVILLGAPALSSAQEAGTGDDSSAREVQQNPDKNIDPRLKDPKNEYDPPGFVPGEDDEDGQSVDEAAVDRASLAAEAAKKLPVVMVEEPKRPIDAKKLKDLKPLSQLVSVNKSGVRPQVLKKPQGSGAIKGMGLTFKTNLQTGTASFGIPISTPSARSGLGPAISFSYSSGGGQGVVGLGWSFGVGFIARQTDQGLPIYDDSIDRFVYAGGTELVRVDPTLSPDTLPSWFDSGRDYYYRAKLEGIFMRVFLMHPGTSSSYWVAQDQSGKLYYFGADETGQRDEDSLTCDSDCDRVFKWRLTKVVDVHENIVEYVYDKNEGHSYLSEVKYNVHPSDPTKFQHVISVNYESREDSTTTWQTGYPITTNWRIATIDVSTDYGDGSHRLVRRYHMGYKTDSFHTLLESVAMEGQNALFLPAVTFEYTEVGGEYYVPEFGYLDGSVIQMPMSPYHSIGDGRRDLLDVNGDGLPDIYETDPTTSGPIQQYLVNRGYDVGIPESSRTAMGNEQSQMLYNTNVRLMDVDGDGKTDLI